MNSKQFKIFNKIFQDPINSNIIWKDVENFMLSIGAKVKEGKGSGGAFVYNKETFPFHRPHPQKEAKKYIIKDLRKFLIEQGIKNGK